PHPAESGGFAALVIEGACSPEIEGEHVPERRLPMRRIREVLRLHFEAQLNERQIAKICSVGKGTVRRYLKRDLSAGVRDAG
ncbi:MAG: hypothetical protein WBQ68_04290, partial [Terriglobales bacterium]